MNCFGFVAIYCWSVWVSSDPLDEVERPREKKRKKKKGRKKERERKREKARQLMAIFGRWINPSTPMTRHPRLVVVIFCTDLSDLSFMGV